MEQEQSEYGFDNNGNFYVDEGSFEMERVSASRDFDVESKIKNILQFTDRSEQKITSQIDTSPLFIKSDMVLESVPKFDVEDKIKQMLGF